MRQILITLAVFGALLASATAHAQYQNRTIGLSVGYLKMNVNENGIDHAIPVGLGASLYIENGWVMVTHFDFMIVTQQPVDQQALGVAPTLGFQYLFSEEDLRPYAGLDLSYLHIFSDFGTSNFFGLGPNLGVDYMVSESVSLGVKAQYNLYLALNNPVQNSFGAQLVAKTYF